MSNVVLYAGVGSAREIGGKDCGWLGLGPVAVLPSYQRRGIGQALVNEGLKTIPNMGAQGCFLVGISKARNRTADRPA